MSVTKRTNRFNAQNTLKKRLGNRLTGLEGLETRVLMAADLAGIATLDADLPVEKSELSQNLELQTSSSSLSQDTANASEDTPAAELDSSQLASAIREAIDDLIANLSGEELADIPGIDILGIKDLVDLAEGLGAFNPPVTSGGEGIDIPDFANPSGFESDSSEKPAASNAESLLSPATELTDHLGGIASTKETHVVPGTSQPGRAGELKWLTADGTRHTYRDQVGETDAMTGQEIVSGFTIESVKVDGTTTIRIFHVLRDGSTLRARRATDANGGEHQWHQLTPPRPADSVDPNADPQAVLLPHQKAPEFNPADGLESPDQTDPGQSDDLGQKGTTINPGDSIVVNPAGDPHQAPEVSDELAEYWKEKLLEKAGGIVNPPGDRGTTQANFAVSASEAPVPGDANLDGNVDFADFLRLSANFGASDAAFVDGDFDNDGIVGFADFLTLSENFGK